MNIQELIDGARLKMGATPEIRLVRAQALSAAANEKVNSQFPERLLSPELLRKIISL